ncbi:MAG: long-chain fatty acid--CoA ligase [Ardenticatenaceae bacterium]|nr:long-chain fatty acid--CoA ligase [Ardenticatenaceae bacterium]
MDQQNLAVAIGESFETYHDQVAMCYLEAGAWRKMSYGEMRDQVRIVARALLALGVQPGDRLGIFAPNRPEWTLTDLGVLSIRGISVPIYATNTAEQAAYIITDTQMTILFTGDQEQYDKVQAMREQLPNLTRIIAFDDSTQLHSADSLYFSQFLQMGTEEWETAVADRLQAATSTELATIIYTSGTTGEPKGVMLTHANLYHQFVAMTGKFVVGPGDRSLCFLPLTHVYERAWSYYIFKTGAANYYLANPKEVIATMGEVKPTVMVSVPRLYEKVYAAVHHSLEGGSALKEKMFHWAVGVGRDYQYRRKAQRPLGLFITLKHALADRLVLHKIRDLVGGPKNFFSAGGAPLAREIEEFFFAAGLLVCEGFGLTECSPMVTFNTPSAFKFGTVGKPIPGCEIRFGENDEILVKSPGVMQGYYNKPEETADAFIDGWFRTGDVGKFDDEGFLRITDRIKDMIITSGGKNIAPQRIETAVAKDHYIEQFIAIGDRRKFISALIVPNFVALREYAQNHGIANTTAEALVQHPDIIAFYRARIDDHSQGLANYEQVKQFTLLPALFSQETGELTPTQKIKRKVVAQNYADVIDAMYPAD